MRALIHGGMALLLCLLVGCGQREETLPKDVSEALTKAYNTDNADACTALYTNDGAILPQSAPTVIGKAAISKLFQSRMASSLQYATSSTVSGAEGDLAFDQGTYIIRNVEQGRDVEFGKYINIFKKVKGKWKIFRTMWNMDSPGQLVTPIRQPAPEPGKAPPGAPGGNGGTH